ncbi:MAG: prolipoprotein diacylglyceryl transferase [Saprospiraceae bacterium]|nr:prolipoprotein diacylglyceryl transferase [Saprospiraceae bacterium]
MYPDLSYILHALLGTPPDNALSIVKTFGLFLIISFLASAWFLRLELKRKEQEGLLTASKEKIIIGKPATTMQIVLNAVLGFVLGFKLVYISTHFAEFREDAAGVLLSGEGSVAAGIAGAILLGFWKYWDSNKRRLDKPVTKVVSVLPHQRVGDITIVAAVSGVIGAKLATIFESGDLFNRFLADPVNFLLSGSGLAIYGGLIVAFVTVLWYIRKKGIAPLHMMDAVAPALMVGYGVGRIGCQLSGDGDWGVVNTAPTPSWWFLPDSWWAFDYPHNVLNNLREENMMLIESCDWDYCVKMIEPVFPTPIYETIMAFIIVGILWALRKRIKVPGALFFIYVLFTAVERYFIEKIRVNPPIEFLGMEGSQAEYISVLLFIVGVGGLYWVWRRYRQPAPG